MRSYFSLAPSFLCNLAVSFLAMALLVGCTGEPGAGQSGVDQTGDQGKSAPAKAIPWFDGSVEEAFAAASLTGKPVFLYWGAQWCPPCHELKATIFQRPEFIQQSTLFVPVYLDGDSDRAQIYGERFGVMGYPTVIIFSPKGEEVTRIPGGMSIERYVGVMDLALNALRPVADLVDTVGDGNPLADEDWKLLAYYSWGQDRGYALGEKALGDTASMLARACPDRLNVEKSMLQMLALDAWMSDEERDAALAEEHRAALKQVLIDERLVRANQSTLLYLSGAMLELLHDDRESKEELYQQLQEVMLGIISNPDTHVLTRLDALYGWLDVNLALLAEGETLTETQQQWLYQQTEEARKSLTSYQQHTAINTVWQLYLDAGLEQEARRALLTGMEVSKQPYYFMSGMGALESKAGNKEEALDWYRKAWENSSGGATRIQWGSNYLRALVKLRPQDGPEIQETGLTILREAAGQTGGLHHRSARGIDRMSEQLLEWGNNDSSNESRHQVLQVLKLAMQEVCSEMTERTETCDTFLQAPQPA
ncbi:MAG: thioredoxin family protein [Halioglobus sp.]